MMKKYLCIVCLLLFSTPAVSAYVPNSYPFQPSEEEIISSLAENLAKAVSWSHKHAIYNVGRDRLVSYYGCIMTCVNTDVHGQLLSQTFCDRVCGISAIDGAMRDAVYYEDTNHFFPSRTNKQLKQIIRDNMEYMFRADTINVQVDEYGHYDVDTGEVIYKIYTRAVKNNTLQ